MLRLKVDEKEGLVEIDLQPPSGYYDQYTVILDEISGENRSLIFSKNFSSAESDGVRPRRLELLILNTVETLKSGCQYELSAAVQRRVSKSLKFSQNKQGIKLSSFSVRPEPVRSTLYFVKSNSSANLTWQAPLVGIFRLSSYFIFCP